MSSAVAETDPEKAIELLKRSLALDPTPDNYRQLASLQNQSKHFQDALQSVNLAIALANDRTDFYEERERSESGLGLSEVERQRHLAAGYTTVGDVQLKQERTSDAYVTYLAALKVLSTIEKSDNSGAAKTDKAVVSSKLDALLDKNREKISARILAIKEGEGKTREVTIDRWQRRRFSKPAMTALCGRFTARLATKCARSKRLGRHMSCPRRRILASSLSPWMIRKTTSWSRLVTWWKWMRACRH
jgi:tetratricopeptide (TPR) repeat protein